MRLENLFNRYSSKVIELQGPAGYQVEMLSLDSRDIVKISKLTYAGSHLVGYEVIACSEV